MPRSQGIFIVLDGAEGCGKSTQARRLYERILAEKREALLVRDPGATPIGERIREILLDPANAAMAMRCEMLLYMAARAQLMREVIAPALERGAVVISDRFVSSTLAYQLGGDGLSAAEINAVAKVATGGRSPDLTILMDMPIERSGSRMAKKFQAAPGDVPVHDRIERRPREYHEQVRRNFLAQASTSEPRCRVILADRTIEEVHRDIWAMVGELI